LLVEEIDIWDSLIKWGIEQTPGLGSENSDKDKWSQENFEALKETLEQYIPLIRFVEISPEEFFDRVRPYKAIIPDHIYEEVAEFYYKKTLPKTTMLPPRSIKTRQIIANWIERKMKIAFQLIKNISSNFFIVVAEMGSTTMHFVISVTDMDHV